MSLQIHYHKSKYLLRHGLGITIQSIMLFCPSELGFQKVYDWMVISLVIAFEALIAHCFLISKLNVTLNCEIPKEFQNMST